MNRDHNESTLGQAIDKLLKTYGLEEGYYAAAICTYWEELMGAAIARRTGEIKLRKGVLRIGIDSASLREELSYGKDKIAERLNRKMGKRLIREVKFE